MASPENSLISIIVVNWNGKNLLDDCLGSIFNQTIKPDEVILVDNGSTDGSPDYVTEYFPQVKLIRLKENTGFCGGNNIGVSYAAGNFIVLLNNDTLVSPSWLEELVRVMAVDERIGLCASCMLDYFNPGYIDTAGDGYDVCGIGFKIGNGQPVNKHNRAGIVFGACGGAVLLRKSMIDEIGLFDNLFFAVGEDIDLSFRAKLSGYVCVYVPRAKVYHKVSQTVGVGSDFLLYHSRRNLEYTYLKNMPLPLLLITLPLHLLYNLMTLFQSIQERKLIIFLRAKKDFLYMLMVTLRKRRHIQSMRTVSLGNLLSSFSCSYLTDKIIRQVKSII